MLREILYEKDLIRIKSGIDKAVNLVKVTLGASGKTVIMKRSFFHPEHGRVGAPTSVTKDGISVLRAITLDDAVENMGVEILKQASEKTMSDCGDATTTTCVLMQAIIEESFNAIEKNPKTNPLHIKKGIELEVEEVVRQLKQYAIPVGDSIDNLLHIATVSANNDPVIGGMIADAFAKIGKDGIVDIQVSKTGKTEVVTSEGVKLTRGYASPYFITNNAKNECELLNPYILLYDKRLTTFAQIEHIVGKVSAAGRTLLVLADAIDGEALGALAYNTQKKTFLSCAVNAPEFGDNKRTMMEDLAALTGGTFISEEKGGGLKNVKLEHLGQAGKVVIGKDFTNIISPHINLAQQTEILNTLKMDLVKASPEEKTIIEKRIASLTGGVAVLSVGAPTEVELGEKRDRCDDAVRAVKAAIAEGFVPGGGTAFLRIQQQGGGDVNGQLIGRMIVHQALRKPFKQICENAGVDYEIPLREIMNSGEFNVGYNVKSGNVEDLVKAGIIDPVKALRVALENAASAAGVIITSGGILCDSI